MGEADNVNVESLDEPNFRMWVQLKLKGATTKNQEKLRDPQSSETLPNSGQVTELSKKVVSLEKKLENAMKLINDLKVRLEKVEKSST